MDVYLSRKKNTHKPQGLFLRLHDEKSSFFFQILFVNNKTIIHELIVYNLIDFVTSIYCQCFSGI